MSNSVSFSSFYFDESLTGHCLLMPSIFIGRSVKRIVSSTEPLQGKGLAWEVVTRVFLSLVCLLICIPSALLIPFGLASKGIASLCQESPQKDVKKKQKQNSSPIKQVVSPNSSTQPKTVLTIEKKEEKEKTLSLTECKVQEISHDGNCAFTCCLEGLEGDLTAIDLRAQTSDWISDQFTAWKKAREQKKEETSQEKCFVTHLRSSLDCYLQEKLNFLRLEQEQAQYGLGRSEIEINHCSKRITEIPSEITAIETQQKTLDKTKDLSGLDSLISTFEQDMRSVEPTKLYHARAIQLYAFSELHGISIEIYMRRKNDFNCVQEFVPKAAKKTVFFELKDLHYNIIKKQPTKLN